MNVSMIQTLQPAKKTIEQTSNAAANKGAFGSVLSRTMETAGSTETASAIKSAETETAADEQLQSLLNLLQLEDLSQLENSQQLTEALLFATQDQQMNVIFENVGDLLSSETVEQLQGLLSSLTSESDLLQQLKQIINQVINEANVTQQRILSVDEGIKLAKVYALFQNVLDMSAENAMKLNELKQKLEQLTAKLESFLVPKEKSTIELMMNKNNASVFSGQISLLNANADQSAAVSLAATNTGTHNPFMNMSKLEQFVLNTQMGDKGSVNSEQLIKSFENIISKAQFTNQNGMQKLFIKLNPEHLGSLRIEIIQQNGTMVAKIVALSQQAKEMLDSQLQGLKQAFINQNIPVEKLELSQQFNNLSQERNFSRDQGQQQSAGETDSETEEQVTAQFQTQFEEALLEAEV